MGRPSRFSPEVRERAIRLVMEQYASLVPIRPNEVRHLRLHQRLRDHADTLPQDIPILTPRAACQRTQTDPFWAWPSSQHLRVVLLQLERTHGKMCDGRFTCLAAAD